jgi:tetratricopeptide (TPR) repeat protein
MGNYTRAKAILTKAIKIFPKHGALYKALGELEAKHGSLDNARKVFQIGIDMDPSYVQLYQSYALIEAQIGDIESLATLRKKAKLNFPNPYDTNGGGSGGGSGNQESIVDLLGEIKKFRLV